MLLSSEQDLHFLIVDDSDDDAEMVDASLRQADKRVRTSHCFNGEKALHFLRHEGEYEGAERADVVLLDINMPGIDGHEVLEAIRNDPELTKIPVVMLTSSDSFRDRESAYAAHANGYVVKPYDFKAFNDAMHVLAMYWLKCARLPPAS